MKSLLSQCFHSPRGEQTVNKMNKQWCSDLSSVGVPGGLDIQIAGPRPQRPSFSRPGMGPDNQHSDRFPPEVHAAGPGHHALRTLETWYSAPDSDKGQQEK